MSRFSSTTRGDDSILISFFTFVSFALILPWNNVSFSDVLSDLVLIWMETIFVLSLNTLDQFDSAGEATMLDWISRYEARPRPRQRQREREKKRKAKGERERENNDYSFFIEKEKENESTNKRGSCLKWTICFFQVDRFFQAENEHDYVLSKYLSTSFYPLSTSMSILHISHP